MQGSAFIKQNRDHQDRLQLLSRVFWKEADWDLLDMLKHVDILFDINDPIIREGAGLIMNIIEHPTDAVLTDLAVDYAQTFIGTSIDSPFPYESVYTSPDRLLMQEARDKVLKIYHEEGFAIPFESNEPEDHISIELEFMAYLSQKIIESMEKDAKEAALGYLNRQKQFLEDHLYNWVPSFCQDIERKARTDFYKGIARITTAYLSGILNNTPRA